MTLRFGQNVVSDDDSDMDFSPTSSYPIRKCSITDLKTLAIEPMIMTNSISFENEEPAHSPVPASPTDRVNKLADWFENCSLNENKCQTKNCFWLNTESNNHQKRPLISSSSNNTFNSNAFSLSQALFEPSQTELWSRFRFTTSTIEKNLWTEQSYSPLPTNQTPMLFSSSQLFASFLTKTSSSFNEKSAQKQSHRKCIPSIRPFFPIFIFIIGFALGYLLTNPFPSSLIHHISFLCAKSIQWFDLLCDYLQIALEYISSDTFFQSL